MPSRLGQHQPYKRLLKPSVEKSRALEVHGAGAALNREQAGQLDGVILMDALERNRIVAAAG